jgi:hypothetical protein
MISDAQIMTAYYREWPGDTDHSDEKREDVCTDVRRCWRARTAAGRLAAFDNWGNRAGAVRYWTRMKAALAAGVPK